MKLKDKVCVVTGAAGSLGQSAARLFVQEGARVVLVDRDAAQLNAAAQTLGADNVEIVVADVTRAEDTRGYVDRAMEKWGRLDVLFGNAGVNGQIAPIADYPEDDFDQVMAVNVRGCFLACKYAMPVMQAGGAVVLTSSVVGVTADPGICAYATSKHALIGLMRVAAKEGAQRGIRVNVIAPGPIDNNFQLDIEKRLSEVVGQDATKMLDTMIALGRHGQPDEIARAVLFLACDDSSFTTGTVLMADGGMHI
ncbi:SDR family NAD(P)-dependent oxidoreductase [Pusillimonas sp.]|uniref:SDR family NAD(P)-dependent oxidoreductase n=1 Tax=Pusillimonas sp. TaxID=3040095 RepID=UPI0037C80397